MIDCSCNFDAEGEGAFCRVSTMSREYRTCGECGAVIWPWEEHVVGWWWDCAECPERCEDPDGYDCDGDREPESTSYMCATCERVVDQLLCGWWLVGAVWEQVADQNGMSVAECTGGDS